MDTDGRVGMRFLLTLHLLSLFVLSYSSHPLFWSILPSSSPPPTHLPVLHFFSHSTILPSSCSLFSSPKPSIFSLSYSFFLPCSFPPLSTPLLFFFSSLKPLFFTSLPPSTPSCFSLSCFQIKNRNFPLGSCTSENNLDFFSSYSRENCLMECREKFIMKVNIDF